MQKLSPHDELVTLEEAAELLGVSIRTVARLQADGVLPAVYLPTVRKARIRRFRKTDVQRLIPAQPDERVS